MTLNWFTDGHLILVVHHKNTLLNCYFDMALDPGHVVADLCTKQQTVIPTRVTAIAGMKVTAEGQQVGGQRRTSIGMSILHGNTYTGQLFTRQYLRVSQVNLRASRFHNSALGIERRNQDGRARTILRSERGSRATKML